MLKTSHSSSLLCICQILKQFRSKEMAQIPVWSTICGQARPTRTNQTWQQATRDRSIHPRKSRFWVANKVAKSRPHNITIIIIFINSLKTPPQTIPRRISPKSSTNNSINSNSHSHSCLQMATTMALMRLLSKQIRSVIFSFNIIIHYT